MTGRELRIAVRCPVCGEEIAAPVWACPRCRTPHHTECAEYFGGCAIFGCRDGHPPAALEEKTWPKAAALLRRLARVRRVQSWFLLLSLIVFILCALVVATAPWAVAGPVGLLGLLGCGGVYAILDILARESWSRLTQELGAKRARGVQIRPDRLRGRLPRFGRQWWHFEWLALGGVAAAAMAVPCALLFHLGPGIALGYFGLMAMAGASQLRRHTEEVELCRHRFEATCLSRPEKEAPRRSGP